MGVEELMPWVLKDSLADRGSSHSVRCGAVVCTVANNTQFLNETHIKRCQKFKGTTQH